ncbi:MAG: isoprenylcysteine carboxylmethyltransferase family protein [Terriglobia bacterium]
MLHIIAGVELVLCWVAWSLVFVKARRRAAGQRKVVRAPTSMWGIVLQTLGFAFVCAYIRPAGFEKSWPSLVASMILGPPSVALAWSATRHLGKQWRYEAALSEDHKLIQTGPYRWIRHPIYASMLGMLLATGAGWTWWPMLVAALVVFLVGTEIRVRAEDRLLGERFREEITAYHSRVRAYIPFIR